MNILDTYTLAEIKQGNPKFSGILNEPYIIPDMTMAEFYIVVMKEEGEEEARFWHNKLKYYCKPVAKEIMIKGLKFREANKKKGLSIFDAVGYVYARENNMRFVTGDKKFEKLPGVMFIK